MRREFAEHVCRAGVDSDFFSSFTQCRLQRCFAWLDSPARERNLTLMGSEGFRPPSEQDMRQLVGQEQRNKHS
jgi:hypothetical protein